MVFVHCTAFDQRPQMRISKPVSVDLAGSYITVIYPPVAISSREAYQMVEPHIPYRELTRILEKSGYKNWEKELKNDFETSVFEQYPLIKEIKSSLYQLGCSYVSMSGSGSAVYGISEAPLDPAIKSFSDSVIWQYRL